MVEHYIAVRNIIKWVKGSNLGVVVIFKNVKRICSLYIGRRVFIHCICLRVLRTISGIRSMDTILNIYRGAGTLASCIIVHHRPLEIIIRIHRNMQSLCFESIVYNRLRFDIHISVDDQIILIVSNMDVTPFGTNVNCPS